MIASRKLAAVAFAGGATLALLAGCAQQAPPSTSYEPSGYFDALAAQQRLAAMRAYLGLPQPGYSEQENARQYQYQPDTAPVTQAAPRRGRRHYNPRNDDDGPVIAEPAPTPPPVPQQPNRPECSGWWRLCHFL
jgi:hypothetical protein